MFAVPIAAALGAIGVPAASAATEFGDNCAATSAANGYTLTTLSAPPGPIPLTAPASGVITQVKVNSALSLPVTLPTEVKLLRSVGGTTFAVTQQAQINIGLGLTTANVRMPVQAGERLALRGTPFRFEEATVEATVFCTEIEGTIGAALGPDPGPGGTVELTETGPARTPVSALIEPDADHDGFGDETQDKCPQAAAVQTACPTITIDSVSVAGKSAVTVYVSVSSDAPVAVSGSVKLGKGKPLTLKAPAKTLTPGPLGKFKLKFPAKLKTKLKETDPGSSLKLKVKASATNVAGVVSTDDSKVPLKGQG